MSRTGTNLSVYVAGSWANREYIQKEFIDKLSARGYTIAHDWTRMEDGTGDRTKHEQSRCATIDFNAACTADVFLAVMNVPQDANNMYSGTFCEMGAALASGRTVIIYNPNHEYRSETKPSYEVKSGLETNIFYWHPDIYAYCTNMYDLHWELDLLYRPRRSNIFKYVSYNQSLQMLRYLLKGAREERKNKYIALIKCLMERGELEQQTSPVDAEIMRQKWLLSQRAPPTGSNV